MSPRHPPSVKPEHGRADVQKVAADPYAGLNMENLRRLTAAGWLIGVVMVAVLLAARPPTVAVGAVGWPLALLMPLGIVGGLVGFRRHPERATPTVILAGGYAGGTMVALLQWLSGGWDAPYHHLCVLFVINGALGHPRRRFLPLGAFLAVVALLPAAYAPDGVMLLNVLVELTIWLVVGAVCAVLMQRVRLQRLTIAEMANSDALTGLANRRAFDATAKAAVRRGRLAVAIADVDRFKDVNDTFGHLAGDECLAAIATTLGACSRTGDTTYRWGGDEFALLMPGADADEARQTCLRLEEAVAASVRCPDGKPSTITFGWAELRPGMTLDRLMLNADTALLERKPARPPRREAVVPTAVAQATEATHVAPT